MRVLTLVLLLAGCASPPIEFYTLAPQSGPVLRGPAVGVELRRVGIAGYLDRPEIVRSSAQYRLRVTQSERWGEPLGRMIERVFTENLVQRLPDAAIFVESGAISARADQVLEVDIQRFDADADGAVVLLAQIAVRRETGKLASVVRTIRLTGRPATEQTADLAAALSGVLGQLADRVAIILAG